MHARGCQFHQPSAIGYYIWLRVPAIRQRSHTYCSWREKLVLDKTPATRKLTQFYLDNNNTACCLRGCFVPRPKSKDDDAVSKVTVVDRIFRLQRLIDWLLMQSDPGQKKACSMMPRGRCPSPSPYAYYFKEREKNTCLQSGLLRQEHPLRSTGFILVLHATVESTRQVRTNHSSLSF